MNNQTQILSVLNSRTQIFTVIFILDEEVETDEVKEAKRLEVEGVKEAEAGHTDRALELFSQAIHIAPEHASSYNNRAQALRLQGDVQGMIIRDENSRLIKKSKLAGVAAPLWVKSSALVRGPGVCPSTQNKISEFQMT